MSQYSSLYCDRGKARTVLQYSHCAHDTASAGGRWASVRAGRAGRACGWACWALGRQALGRQARRACRASGRAEHWLAHGRASGRHGRAGARGRRQRALGAGRTGRWAQAGGACAAGAGSVRGIGRQGARLGAPGGLAVPIGGSCTRLDFQTGFSTRYFS